MLTKALIIILNAAILLLLLSNIGFISLIDPLQTSILSVFLLLGFLLNCILLHRESITRQKLQKSYDNVVLQADEIKRIKNELIQAQELIKQSTTSRNRFMSRMRHSTRSQIGAIIQVIEFMILSRTHDIPLEPESEIEYLRLILKTAEQIITNTHDEIIWSYVNVESLIANCISHQKEEAIYDDLHLRYNITKDVADIYTDAGKIEQIITGLIYRAIEDVPKSFIHVNAKKISIRKRRHLEITVQDDGNGLSETDWQKRVDKFDMNAPVSRQTNGTDLEYGAIKKLVGLLNGEMTFANNPLKGTSIKVIIPYRTEQEVNNMPLKIIPDSMSEELEQSTEYPENVVDIADYQ